MLLVEPLGTAPKSKKFRITSSIHTIYNIYNLNSQPFFQISSNSLPARTFSSRPCIGSNPCSIAAAFLAAIASILLSKHPRIFIFPLMNIRAVHLPISLRQETPQNPLVLRNERFWLRIFSWCVVSRRFIHLLSIFTPLMWSMNFGHRPSIMAKATRCDLRYLPLKYPTIYPLTLTVVKAGFPANRAFHCARMSSRCRHIKMPVSGS